MGYLKINGIFLFNSGCQYVHKGVITTDGEHENGHNRAALTLAA